MITSLYDEITLLYDVIIVLYDVITLLYDVIKCYNGSTLPCRTPTPTNVRNWYFLSYFNLLTCKISNMTILLVWTEVKVLIGPFVPTGKILARLLFSLLLLPLYDIYINLF